MQTVVCMRWGDRFPVDYVNRLYRGVMRNVARPTRFVASPTTRAASTPASSPATIPPIKLPATGLGGSPWRKLALWSPAHRPDRRPAVPRPRRRRRRRASTPSSTTNPASSPSSAIPARGTPAIPRSCGSPPAAAPHLVERFEARPAGQSGGSIPTSRSISAASPVCRWYSGPKDWAPSFKAMMLPRFPLNHFQNVTLPEGARVVVFTGHPRPHEALRGEWPARGWKKIYKRVRPVAWLDAHWR